jgi:serine/threonine protein kinase
MELSNIDPEVFVKDCKGLVIGGDLKIGGQKRVWRCAYKDKAYVLKALMAEDTTLLRVRREIEVMRTCSSQHLPTFGPIPLQEIVLSNGAKLLYFLEEYIDGLPLSSVHKPMTAKEVVNLGLCIAGALKVLSRNGYIHRDVKPMNILQKTGSHYILIDAGYALDRDGEALTLPGNVVGTRPYLSPDQILLAPKKLDIRSDMFALGITMYECAAGEHPFLNDDTPNGDLIHTILNIEPLHPSHFNPSVPKNLASIILKLLRKERDERYKNLDYFRDDLLRLGSRQN